MPRILPRLLKALETTRARDPKPRPTVLTTGVRPKRGKYEWSAPLEWPSFTPEPGEQQSVILEETNPILHASRYILHRLPGPKVRYSDLGGQKPESQGKEGLRLMTEEEKEWWSNPYLRMLGAPYRRCFMTRKVLPKDFMVRLLPVQLPVPRGARNTQLLVPDGVEHPRYKSRRNNKAFYLVCRKKALRYVLEREYYKRTSTNAKMHHLVIEQVDYLLRLRILQELEFLADKVRCHPQEAEKYPILRRLTRAEFKEVRKTGTIPYKGAIALLVVPPVNKDPKTKQLPKPIATTDSMPPISEENRETPNKPLPPLSILHSASSEEVIDEQLLRLPNILPVSQLPLYNGLALFPSRSQRNSLHNALNNLLFVEQRARWREFGSKQKNLGDSAQSTQHEKPSHAYLLCSDPNTLGRADSVPLVIALWRLRLWEGVGWEGEDMGGLQVSHKKSTSLNNLSR